MINAHAQKGDTEGAAQCAALRADHSAWHTNHLASITLHSTEKEDSSGSGRAARREQGQRKGDETTHTYIPPIHTLTQTYECFV